MPTVSRRLPARPHLDVPKRQARELLEQCRNGERDALHRILRRHPKFENLREDRVPASTIKLSDAQLVIAREYGFSSWAALKRRIAVRSTADALEEAIRSADRDAVVAILRAHPEMLDLPLRSGDWGPPMSHAANLGQLEIIQACAELGARDVQHAFDRALLQGQIECAAWLHAHGARLMPGIIMGCCETLNAAGFKFLHDRGAPLTNEQGDRRAPLALALETYSRNPAGKHAILGWFADHGYDLPDTPAVALHRGDLPRLEKHLRRDPHLLERRFTLGEIFPHECGCARDGKSGLHWTPIDGATLLHIAIDFHEREIFHWLLARGADVNARAAMSANGFGGHTPLFNTVVSGPWPDAAMARTLLERGADPGVRASLRKFLDWIANPHWHEARNVTAREWGHTFPEKNWVNRDALKLLDDSPFHTD
jgi:hypothetical protein